MTSQRPLDDSASVLSLVTDKHGYYSIIFLNTKFKFYNGFEKLDKATVHIKFK